MGYEPFNILKSGGVPLPIENVDTDQIIPARFLKATERKGFGDNLFRDWRYDSDDSPKKDFVLNKAQKISKKSSETLKIGKEAFYKQLDMKLSDAYDYASKVMAQNMLKLDAKEGIDAFIDKREPIWKDK